MAIKGFLSKLLPLNSYNWNNGPLSDTEENDPSFFSLRINQERLLFMNLVTAVVLPDEMDKLLNVFVDSRDKPFLSSDNTDICTLFADKGTLTLYQLQGSITDIVDALSIQNQYQKVALRCDLNMNAILEEFERIGDAVTNMCISDSKTIFNCSFDKELPDDMFRVWIAAQ